jgi:hypothetical protein
MNLYGHVNHCISKIYFYYRNTLKSSTRFGRLMLDPALLVLSHSEISLQTKWTSEFLGGFLYAHNTYVCVMDVNVNVWPLVNEVTLFSSRSICDAIRLSRHLMFLTSSKVIQLILAVWRLVLCGRTVVVCLICPWLERREGYNGEISQSITCIVTTQH